MVDVQSKSEHLWVETPLVYSKHRSAALNADVYFKLDVGSPTLLVYCESNSD